MKMTFRWYGDDDPVTLDKIRQIPGIVGIVSAIYDIPVGEAWDEENIFKLKNKIEEKGLELSVIESVPVHEDIKLGRGDRDRYIENYCITLRNLAKAGVANKRFLREFRLEDNVAYNVGDEIKADIFAEGDKIDVTGISKGHGYAGTVKRWGTHRGPMSHGSGYHRGVGSMGACSTPSRVMKNKRLPGHMGVDQVTIQNLDVVKVDAEKNLILVKGAVPGPKGGIVTIRNSVKA